MKGKMVKLKVTLPKMRAEEWKEESKRSKETVEWSFGNIKHNLTNTTDCYLLRNVDSPL